SSVSFDEPGIYRYIITETASTSDEAAGIMHDNDVDRVLDVYVTDDGNGALAVSSYVMHTDEDSVALGDEYGSDPSTAQGGADLKDKTDGFTNEYNSKDLVFKKEVTGNQASRDKYFEFTAKLGNVNDDDVFTVSLADDSNDATTDGNADAKSGTNSATIAANQEKDNPTSVTGAQLKAGVKFYLQHGQSIAIRGIAPNATYEITENAEDYKSTPSAVSGYEDATSGTIGTVAATDTVANAKAVMTSFQNQRNGVIPTGILMSATPWIILGIVLIGGIVFFAIRSKKRYEED
ncbi:MAG: QVPTGV class sortase B protein-sorting domain-containing protein, partial [Eubacterium sp.]|nr:QVPTGV class sortase B protein-sorting domain-containing protein [Eubacterium sp.]